VLGAVQAPFLPKARRLHREDRLQVGGKWLLSRGTAGDAAFGYRKAFIASRRQELVLIPVDPLGQQLFASHSNFVMHT